MTQVRDDGGSEPGGGSVLQVRRLDSGCKRGREAKHFKAEWLWRGREHEHAIGGVGAADRAAALLGRWYWGEPGV